VSAALHAGIAAALFAWALRRFPLRWALAIGVVLLLATAPPIASDNVIGGFQSQFYFLIGFSLLVLRGWLDAPFSRRWWGGLAAAALVLVSMGSGFLVAAPVAGVLVLRGVKRERRARELA